MPPGVTQTGPDPSAADPKAARLEAEEVARRRAADKPPTGGDGPKRARGPKGARDRTTASPSSGRNPSGGAGVLVRPAVVSEEPPRSGRGGGSGAGRGSGGERAEECATEGNLAVDVIPVENRDSTLSLRAERSNPVGSLEVSSGLLWPSGPRNDSIRTRLAQVAIQGRGE